jgi:5-methylcytosine-specific restriction endonuclease McrA
MRRYGGSTRAYRKARAQVLMYATHCWICGRPPTYADPFVADHYIPRSLGGGDHAANLRPAHRSCNARRSNKLPPELRVQWR